MSTPMKKRPALGKGLASLLPQRNPPSSELAAAPEAPAGPVTQLEIAAIRSNPDQPRKDFRHDQLHELASSILRDGVIQPLVVRLVEGKYELVAGERRLRAAKIAGLQQVPVVVQTIADDRLLEVALIENIQREDLNPIELAVAFERMAAELNLNHEEIGARTGKDRTTITNAIRLLQLPKDLQDMVARRELTPGHARGILKLRNESAQREMAKRVVEEGWTVRQVERATQGGDRGESSGRERTQREEAPLLDPNIKAAIDQMERSLGTRVKIFDKGNGKGKIEIEYYSPDELDRIYTLLTKED
jgi:ParB family chromosome partitioning protein